VSYDVIALWSEVASALLFIVAIVLVWKKYIQPAVLVAQQAQNAKIAEAERHRDDAKAALETLRIAIADAQTDAQAIRARARAQAEAEYRRTIAEAEAAGERTVRNARGELERSRSAAAEQLRVDLVDRAAAYAREEAGRRIDRALNGRLVNDFLAALPGSSRQ